MAIEIYRTPTVRRLDEDGTRAREFFYRVVRREELPGVQVGRVPTGLKFSVDGQHVCNLDIVRRRVVFESVAHNTPLPGDGNLQRFNGLLRALGTGVVASVEKSPHYGVDYIYLWYMKDDGVGPERLITTAPSLRDIRPIVPFAVRTRIDAFDSRDFLGGEMRGAWRKRRMMMTQPVQKLPAFLRVMRVLQREPLNPWPHRIAHEDEAFDVLRTVLRMAIKEMVAKAYQSDHCDFSSATGPYVREKHIEYSPEDLEKDIPHKTRKAMAEVAWGIDPDLYDSFEHDPLPPTMVIQSPRARRAIVDLVSSMQREYPHIVDILFLVDWIARARHNYEEMIMEVLQTYCRYVVTVVPRQFGHVTEVVFL